MVQAESAAASARDIYRCHRSFEKAVAIDGKRETYLTGDTTVDYAEVKDQTLLYHITLVTSADENGEIVFEDILPEGTAWGKGSGNNKLFVDGVQQNWYNGGWQITSAPDAANGNLLKVSVQGCDDGKAHTIEYPYQVSFKNDSRWNSLLTTDVPYTNRAKWGEEEKASITTTVHRDAAPLTKTGKIFITNTVYPGYELPSTGGRGTAPFVLAGGIMVLDAALLLACGRVRRRKEETK